MDSYLIPAIRKMGAEAYQTTLFCGLSKSMNCGKLILHSRVGEISASNKERQASTKDQP